MDLFIFLCVNLDFYFVIIILSNERRILKFGFDQIVFSMCYNLCRGYINFLHFLLVSALLEINVATKELIKRNFSETIFYLQKMLQLICKEVSIPISSLNGFSQLFLNLFITLIDQCYFNYSYVS